MQMNKSAWQMLMKKQQILREQPVVSLALKIIQYALLIAIVAYLFWRFSRVGWQDVFDNLPLSPWFYLFFAARFLALPISEMIIYEMIWGVRLHKHFPAFLRKRVYNYAVMGYSGEGFFTLWARRELRVPDKTIIVAVKDNNLLSALASNLATVFFIILLIFTDNLQAGINSLPSGGLALFVLAFTSSSILATTVIILRKRVIGLRGKKLRNVMSMHAARTAFILILHAAMYAAALPDASFSAWMMFLALQLVISRIPFIPNQDLVFMGAAISLAPLVNSSEAALAGMLLAEAGLSQIINLILFGVTSYLAKP